MKNLKSYRDKELRYYIIANIGVLLLLLDFFHMTQYDHGSRAFEMVSIFINMSILSSTIYVLVFVVDSFFSDNIKIRLSSCHRQHQFLVSNGRGIGAGV